MQPMRRLLPWLLCPVFTMLLCLLVFSGVRLRTTHDPLSASASTPCTTVPSFDQVWGRFSDDARSLEAAVYTPYHITPGGGEKYLLSVVQALQHAGFMVSVYTNRGNACRNKDQLMETAAALRVDLNPDKLSFNFWGRKPPKIQPRVFFSLGNGKFPMQRNLGQLGFYMCQFPFDLDSEASSHEDVDALSTYDQVLVNSHFSFSWYNTYITPTLSRFRDAMIIMPSINILHPPCAMLSYDAAAPRKSIVMLGRFFSGRQNKGHAHAIKLFAKISPHLPADIRLVLVGQLAQGHEDYVERLRDLAEDLEAISSRVDFVISATPQTVADHLRTSVVQWHMTGLEVEADVDPASREHFGISIVESMSAGSIPIALYGGPADIIQHGVDGYLAHSAQDFSRYTLEVFRADAAAVRTMRSRAVEKAAAFSYASFQKNFLAYVHQGLLARPYRYFVSTTLPMVRACARPNVTSQSPMTAMIVEGRNDFALEYVIYNVMSVLHKSSAKWSLHVFHTPHNRALLERIVSARLLRRTHLHELPAALLDPANLTAFMKSETVWSSLGNAKKVLVFQTDSLIVNPGIERFLQYDYVGAPWSRHNERWDAIAAHIPSGVGNGGFSLRSVPVMKEIARQYGKRPKPAEPEDVFYAQHVSKYHHLCPRAEAYDFCFETPCDDLVQAPDGPFAMHAAWLYWPLETVQRLLYRSFVSSLCDDCLDRTLQRHQSGEVIRIA